MLVRFPVIVSWKNGCEWISTNEGHSVHLQNSANLFAGSCTVMCFSRLDLRHFLAVSLYLRLSVWG